MALKLKPFDAAKYIATPAAQAALVADAFKSGHAGYIAAALGVAARAHSMTRLAAETGLSRQALYGALSEDGNPTLDTVLKVTRALGIEIAAQPGFFEHDPVNLLDEIEAGGAAAYRSAPAHGLVHAAVGEAVEPYEAGSVAEGQVAKGAGRRGPRASTRTSTASRTKRGKQPA